MSLSKLSTSSHFRGLDEESESPGAATIYDLPPEVLTLLLEYLLERNKKNILNGRLVNSQWKGIIDSLLENGMVSGSLKPFPELRVKTNRPKQLYATSLSTRSILLERKGRNPFPFNSVAVWGEDEERCWKQNHFYKFFQVSVALPNFGRNLSSFALHYHSLRFSQLATMLGWMPGLRCLTLSFVRASDCMGHVVIPTPPALPSLSVLNLESTVRYGDLNDDFGILYIWIVASYADQLIRLSIDREESFPPLRKQHRYYVQDDDGPKIFVAATSESAFAKLKELKISSEISAEFLRLSELPSLQRFSVFAHLLNCWVGLDDLTEFMGCSNTLLKLRMDICWDRWGEGDEGRIKLGKGKPKATSPYLKTLTVMFPSTDYDKTIMYRSFVDKFPGLEELHLIRFDFPPNSRNWNAYLNEVDLDDDSCDEEEHAELKQQLASLEERETVLEGELNDLFRRAEARRARRSNNGVFRRWSQVAAKRRLIVQESEENADLRHQIEAGRREKTSLLKQLDDLNRKRGIAREFRDQGIWSTCPKLRIVSVSSDSKRCGDICVIRRPDVNQR